MDILVFLSFFLMSLMPLFQCIRDSFLTAKCIFKGSQGMFRTGGNGFGKSFRTFPPVVFHPEKEDGCFSLKFKGGLKEVQYLPLTGSPPPATASGWGCKRPAWEGDSFPYPNQALSQKGLPHPKNLTRI